MTGSRRQRVAGAAAKAVVALLILAFACDDDGPTGPGGGGIDPALYRADTAVVRQQLDLNGLQSVGVAAVTDSSTGRVTSLNLRNMGIARLSNEIGRLDAVMWLYLSGNYLTTLPDSITNLEPCSTLTVGRNRLCGLPTRIRGWVDLYVTVPGWDTMQDCVQFDDDTAAVRVILDTNGLVSVGTMAVCDTALGHVTALHLAHRGLAVLPDTIGALTRLVRLDLHDNVLDGLPQAVLTLDSLQEALLDDNRLCSLDTVLAAWADVYAPGWRFFQDCSTTVVPAHDTALFSGAYGPVPDSVSERDPGWLRIATTTDSLVIDSITVSADTLSPPLVAKFRPVGVPAYDGTTDTFCVLRTAGTTYGPTGGMPLLTLGAEATAYAMDFELQPCLECSSLAAVPGLVIGTPLRMRAVFHFRRMYPDTLIAGRDTLVVKGAVDGTAVGELSPLASQLMEFSNVLAETVDFSALAGDTCDDYLDLHQDTAYDFMFWTDTLRAPRGIKLVYDGQADNDVLPCDTVTALRTCLDTLSYAVQQAGYKTAAPLVVGGSYYVWTREQELVLLMNVGNYLGGVPRYQFFWARYTGQ